MFAAAGRQGRQLVNQYEYVAGIAAHTPHEETRGRFRQLDAAAADPELHRLQAFLVGQRLQLPDLSRCQPGPHVVTLKARPRRRTGRRQHQPRAAPFEFPAKPAHRLLHLGRAGDLVGVVDAKQFDIAQGIQGIRLEAGVRRQVRGGQALVRRRPHGGKQQMGFPRCGGAP